MRIQLTSTIALFAAAVTFSAVLGDSAWAKQRSAWDGRAPSFSCKGDLSKIESMICADQKVSQLDYFLGLTYHQTRRWVSSEEWKSVIDVQSQWLVERDRCEGTACLIAKMGERSARLLEIQEQAARAVQLRFNDKRFAETAVAAGVEALRKKYGAEMDQYGDGRLATESFVCSPSAYQRLTCSAALGPTGTCDDGSRSGDGASFDVVAPAASEFRILNATGYQACSGAPFAIVRRHTSR